MAYDGVEVIKMPDIITISVLAFFCLYGIIEFCSLVYTHFFKRKNKNGTSYFVFCPSGDSDKLEYEIRNGVSFASDIRSKPALLLDDTWDAEMLEIARILTQEYEIKSLHKSEFEAASATQTES